MERIPDSALLFKARIAGFCWLMTILSGIFALTAGGGIIVAGDPAATAANILAQEGSYRLGTVANLIATAFYVAATLFVYELLKPVNRSLSLLAAFFSLVGCAVGAFSSLFDFAPFVLLKGAEFLTVFTVEQLQALSLVILRIGGQAGNISLVFFGLHCLLVGFLILRSAFLPRTVGALMAFGGLGWLTYLWPPLASSLSPYSMAPGIIGEVSLTLWLIVFGVNVQRWNEQNATSTTS